MGVSRKNTHTHTHYAAWKFVVFGRFIFVYAAAARAPNSFTSHIWPRNMANSH